VPGVVDPQSVGSSFGAGARDFVEVVGARLRVENPRARLIHATSYRPDLAFSIAQTLWTFSGSADTGFIEFYNPRGRDFSSQGRLLSAPGPRIFGTGVGAQFSAAVKLLARDKSSRRAMIQIFLPEDMVYGYRDASCIGSVQLLLRDDRLHSIVTMRSQSAARVLPYDSFLLSMIHEAAALELGITMGDYILFCGSLHYYAEEADLVEALIGTTDRPPAPMPPMESKLSSIGSELGRAEVEIRGRLARNIRAAIEFGRFNLDPYWTDVLKVLVIGIRMRRGAHEDTELAELPAVYRSIIAARRDQAGSLGEGIQGSVPRNSQRSRRE